MKVSPQETDSQCHLETGHSVSILGASLLAWHTDVHQETPLSHRPHAAKGAELSHTLVIGAQVMEGQDHAAAPPHQVAPLM